jgi:pre-mRNA-splicing factor SYF1
MIELKIVVPQTIINYAIFLEDNNYFEESFKIYEKGVELFQYPTAFDIWNVYLQKFVERYKGTKLERARELFDSALVGCPDKFVKAICLLYAKLEEEFGTPKRAIQIYLNCVMKCLKEDMAEIYNLAITKSATFLGLPSCRQIYDLALENLTEEEARTFGMKYVELEIKMGEVDRARAIFGYLSQFTDPRTKDGGVFWKKWHEFEVDNGNEDTFKEMLRVKRSVEAEFNSRVEFMAEQLLAKRREEAMLMKPSDTFISGGHSGNANDAAPVVETKEAVVEMEDQPSANQEEIKIDYMENDDEDEDKMEVEQRNVVVLEEE